MVFTWGFQILKMADIVTLTCREMRPNVLVGYINIRTKEALQTGLLPLKETFSSH